MNIVHVPLQKPQIYNTCWLAELPPSSIQRARSLCSGLRLSEGALPFPVQCRIGEEKRWSHLKSTQQTVDLLSSGLLSTLVYVKGLLWSLADRLTVNALQSPSV